MNEIQRFKKNRMIPKGLYGLKPHEVLGGAVNGETVGYVNIPGKGYLAIDAKGNAYTTRNETKNGGFSRNTTFVPVKLTNYDRQQIYKAVSRNDGVTSWIRDHSNNIANYWKAKGVPVVTKPASKPVNAPVDAQQNASVGNSEPVNPGKPTRPRVDYAAKFSGMNFTDDEKRVITEAGFDPNNAKSVQDFILSKASGANLGARAGAGKSDGYWGDKSAAAFEALRNQGIFKPKVDAQEPIKPVNETPVDAPDFGYATNQDYSNGRQFKNLGFNNYQGLLRYAQGSQDQFAQDLRQRFGDRITDQAYVESQLGISGKYRGGSAGDFGDMARSMQAWKTNVNQQFDNNRAAYAKKQLDARTGSNGTVYSSPEMMKKFESVKVSPEVKFGMNQGTKFDFSNMKFNSGLGTTGVNTLGDAGAGTINNQKQLTYADK